MGVINVTPDSFSDGGDRFAPDVAVEAAVAMAEAGADIVDVGGESTRPGAAPLSVEDELRRVVPVLDGLRGRLPIPVSVDTYKAAVAERAFELGAAIVNDVSALTYDPDLAGVVARTGMAVVLMHTRGRSSDMYAQAAYDSVADDVAAELGRRADEAQEAGIAADRIILDPGLGFAKRAEHSMAALAGIPRLAKLGYPILSGPSRKSFLTQAIGSVPPTERRWGTAAAVAASVFLGAHVVRVHDVAEMVQVVRTADAIRAAAGPTLGSVTPG